MTDIAIVGAGLSGLVLARVLQNNDIPATVYELDASADARTQGGSLDIHEDSGQVALHAAGLHDEFRKHTHPQGESIRVFDKAGTLHIDHEPPGGEGGRPEIDRTVLRRMLIDSLDEGTIRWGHKLSTVRTLDAMTAAGRHELTFANGTTAVADLLVGADGTWSKVRPLVSAAIPEYCGISHIELDISPTRHPELAALVGPGMVFALSDNKGFLGHGGAHIQVGASLRVPQDWLTANGVDWTDATAARAALLAEFADWSPQLTDLIRACDDTITPRQIFALPVGHSWPRVPGVTLVGDAAHVMAPYAGEGANLAMFDATELAQAVIEHPDDLETALTRYETAMFPRAAESAEGSLQGLDMCFSADAPREIVGFFSGAEVRA